MAETNFLIFNEENNPDRTYNDSEYKNATQRLTGVIPGMALSRQHNKMYFQWSAMCKAIADFLVTSGYNCMDNNVEGITEGLTKTVTDMIKKDLSTHNTDNEAHKTLFDKKLDTTGGTLTGDLNASGYNITATKFIGNLQGKADNATNADLASKATTAENANNASNATHATSATNADLATKATQDSQGQTINTTYVKGITASNATLTVTKGNGTTSTVTINNVANASKLGTANVGSANKPIYLNAGTATACNTDLSTLAPKASPGLTGTPTAPTANVDTNNTQIATCGFVRNAIAKYAPMLDTMKKIYPVGSIYMSTVSTNPATLFGFGTWEAMPAGRVLLAQGKSSWGTTYNAGSTGGEATHQLTVGEMPSHNHAVSIQSSGEHNHIANSNTSGTHSHVLPTANALGSGSGYVIGTSNGGTLNTSGNGEHSHVITINNNGSHTHNTTVKETGSGQAHSNMPPYLAIYIWKRVS